MANQVLGTPLEYFEISSFTRGVHAYALYWETHTTVGQVFQLRREPENFHDVHAVAIVAADNCTVGHAPYNLAPILSSFLARDFNKGSVETTGVRINRRAGYGLEVPCIYRLYGTKTYIKALKMAVSKLKEKSLL